jgi:hypothetical protein
MEDGIMRKAKIVALISCVMLLALVFSCATSGGGGGAGFAGVWERWSVDDDSANGGSSTIAMTEETQEGLPANSFTGNITNQYQYGDVYPKMYPDPATIEQLQQAKAVSFRFQGDGDQYAVKFVTSEITDSAYFEYVFETVDGQPITVIVPIEFFMQPSWGKAVAPMVNTELIKFIEFQTKHNGNPGPFAFKVWDFRVHTKGIPKEKDVLPKGAAKPKAGAAAELPVGGDFSPFEVNLIDNFQYGNGYQAVLAEKRFFNGHKIVAGENYTLKITYTASRDLEEDIAVGLVDPSAAANYWRPLTYKNDSKDNPIMAPEPNGAAVLPKSKAGETVTATLKMTTLANATSASASCNAIVFATIGAGSKGSPGSGKMKAVKLTCTEFVLSKD